MFLATGATDWVSSIGTVIGGFASLFVALSAGVGFIVRTRQARQREAARIQAATKAAQEATQAALEQKLDESYKTQIHGLEEAISTKDARINELVNMLIQKDQK